MDKKIYRGYIDKVAKVSESVIEEIKRRLSITEVVSQYVTLSRKGDRLWGLCPFHHEKTPSFSVREDEGFYYCFGCHKGGNMFQFIQEIEHVSFYEALGILAKKAGVELKEETEEDRRKRTFEESLFELYAKIAKTFNYILVNNPEAGHAREYLKNRGITDETRDKFLLGYAPKDTTWLYRFLRKNNYSPEFLAKTGLFSPKYPEFPYFADRIMFPVRTWQGSVVAFGARDLTGVSRAKYINTPETDIYKKRLNLYGIFEALPALKTKNSVILCEGNFDLVSMHQSGITNTVATFGTAFTTEQAKLLQRYCEKITIMFDSDNAGQEAARKAVFICQQIGLEASVLVLPGAKDASEILEKEGPEVLVNACDKSINGYQYLVQNALKRYDVRKPKSKYQILKEVQPFLEATTSEVEKQGYIKYLSDVLNTSETTIISDLQTGETGNRKKQETIEETPAKQTEINPFKLDPDLSLMLILANNRDAFGKYRSEIKISALQNEVAKKIYAVLEDSLRLGYKSDEMVLEICNDPDTREILSKSFVSEIYRRDESDFVIMQNIRLIKLKGLEAKRDSVMRVIKLNLQTGTSFNSDSLTMLGEKQELDVAIQKLKDEISAAKEN